MKKFWVNLCVFAMVLVMSAGCAATALAYSEEEVVYITEQYLSSWVSTDFGQYLEAGITDEAALEQFTNWQNLKDNMGDIEEVSEYQITEQDGVISVSETLICTNDTIIFTVTFDQETAETLDAYSAVMEITAVSASAASGSEGASFGKAAMNTLMGMSIVFLVLIFISLIISLLKYIPGMLDKMTGKKGKETEEKIERPAFAAAPVMEPASSDEEIAAVITAAVMAYEAETGAAPGTFVVRSIKRRQK